jgi:hypothetical protein
MARQNDAPGSGWVLVDIVIAAMALNRSALLQVDRHGDTGAAVLPTQSTSVAR